jgi:hypothetical protein
MTRLGELLSSFVTWGSTRSRPLKLAYLTGLETLNYMSNKQEYPKIKCNWIIRDRHQETPSSINSLSLKMATLHMTNKSTPNAQIYTIETNNTQIPNGKTNFYSFLLLKQQYLDIK